MRLIDADALWKDITTNIEYCADILEIIEKQPTIEPEPKWIPCSERLPEDGRYLVNCSLSVFSPQVMNYSDGEWYYDGCQSMDLEIPTINAWMPLPPCYKEEQE